MPNTQNVTARGFVPVDFTPGCDPVGATGQVARRYQLDLLHPRRARLGFLLPRPPSLKLATSTARMAAAGRHGHQLRRNCGRQYVHQEIGPARFELVLATASGEHSKSEKHGYGQNEFVPWQVGAVM